MDLLDRKDGPGNISTLEHLVDLLSKILNDKSAMSHNLDQFEALSSFWKKSRYVEGSLSQNQAEATAETTEEQDQLLKKAQMLLKRLSKVKNLKKHYTFPNIIAEQRSLKLAGLGFGEEETYWIHQSLRNLAEKTDVKALRFWGKILCRGSDYYVAEGITNMIDNDTRNDGIEPKGQGANRFTHWVTHDEVLDRWIELPIASPEHIRMARDIKYIFSGDLEKPIHIQPAFQGQEKHLVSFNVKSQLKAQIIRISSATVLAPKGLYKLNDDDAKEIELEEEQFKLPEYSDLKNGSSWVHLHSPLLHSGRTKHWADPSLPEEKRQELLDEQLEKDPEIERLKDITEEKCKDYRLSLAPYWKEGDEDESPNWSIREYGDVQQYNLVDKDDGKVGCHSVICFKNQTWPGANLVASVNFYCKYETHGWINIYIGYAMKTGQAPFLPVQPLLIAQHQGDQDEFRDVIDPSHSQPNPKNLIKEQSPTNDEEDADGQGNENQNKDNDENNLEGVDEDS